MSQIEVVSDGHVIAVKDRATALEAHRWWIEKLVKLFKEQDRNRRAGDE